MSEQLNRLLESLESYKHKNMSNAVTLEGAHYTSSELYEFEVEKLWKKQWICVSHTSELKEPGDFIAVELLDEPIVVVRGDDMEIRALTSVCRHRFMPIVTHGERGNLSEFQCPYHRWTYGLDGQLNSAIHMEQNECFNREEIKLPEFRVEIWNNLVFINLDEEAEPLAPTLEGLNPVFEEINKLTTSEFIRYETYDKQWASNWKSSNENSLESYHHMGVHGETLELYAPTRNSQDVRYGENWTVYDVPYAMELDQAKVVAQAGGWEPGVLGQDVPTLTIIMIFPSIAVTISPVNIGYFTMWPEGVDKTRVWCAAFGNPNISDRGVMQEMAGSANETSNFIERVMDEDGTAMPGIGRSMKSSKIEPGKLAWMEEPIVRFYAWYANQMTS